MRLNALRTYGGHILTVLLICVVLHSGVRLLQSLAWGIYYSPLFNDSDRWEGERKHTHVLFLRNGTYHRIEVTSTRKSRNDYDQYKRIYDANGTLIWEGQGSGDDPTQYLHWALWRNYYGIEQMWSRYSVNAEFSSLLEVPVKSVEGDAIRWRYQHQDEIFVGYDRQGGIVGVLGSDGFMSEPSQVRPLGQVVNFEAWVSVETAGTQMLWATKQGLYQFDFMKQAVKTLYGSSGADIVRVATHGWESLSADDRNYVDPNLYRPLIDCITTDGCHHLILREPDQVIHCTVPPAEVEDQQDFGNVAATRDNLFLRLTKLGNLSEEIPQPRHKSQMILFRVDDQGALSEMTRTDWIVNDWRIRGWSALKPINSVSPLATRLIFGGYWKRFFNHGDKGWGPRPTGLRDWLFGISPFGYEVWVVSSICALVAVWHMWKRRRSWPWLVSWLVFVALFNLAGLLTYLALHHTPLLRCQVCGKKRTVTQPTCVHCGAGLPIPQPGHTILIPA